MHCGCKILNFELSGLGYPIAGTPYVPKREWWYSHGVRVKATGGYTPNAKARLYDTAAGGVLGTPNQQCGGQGEGNAGGPYLSDGSANPGANCQDEGLVLIVQESNKGQADGAGGVITFDFAVPTTLHTVGLLNMLPNDDNYIQVLQQEGTVTRLEVVGYGTNSVEEVAVHMDRVTSLKVHLGGSSGAVRNLSLCYASCPDVEDDAVYVEDNVYALQRAMGTVLSNALVDAYDDNVDSCLFAVNPQAAVTLTLSNENSSNLACDDDGSDDDDDDDDDAD